MRWKKVAALAALLMILAGTGCGGQSARDGSEADDKTIVVKGRLSRRGSTPFSSTLLEAEDGKAYWIRSAGLGFELRQLDGMNVEVTGWLVPNDEGENILAIQYYDLLRLPSGERPIVGILRSSGGYVWITDDNDVDWTLRGDFQEVLRSFAGAKVWVTGVVQRSLNVGRGSMRTLLVTEYGVIRQ